MLLLKVTIIEQISTTTNTKPAPRSNRNGHEPKRGNRGRGAERPRLLPGRDARGPAAPLGVARGPVDVRPPLRLHCLTVEQEEGAPHDLDWHREAASGAEP